MRAAISPLDAHPTRRCAPPSPRCGEGGCLALSPHDAGGRMFGSLFTRCGWEDVWFSLPGTGRVASMSEPGGAPFDFQGLSHTLIRPSATFSRKREKWNELIESTDRRERVNVENVLAGRCRSQRARRLVFFMWPVMKSRVSLRSFSIARRAVCGSRARMAASTWPCCGRKTLKESLDVWWLI